ncbi:MAG: ROK family protein [Hyphomicrobiales bacterium]
MHIGIDIGGSAVKLGGLTAEGQVIGRARLPVSPNMTFAALIETIAEACRGVEETAGAAAEGVGAACPGYCDPGTGAVIDGAGNIPCLQGQSLRAALAQRLDRPVVVENDGIAAALGEMAHGAGRRLRRFALITLGTGVGGAVVLEGRVVAGPRGEPPELGAIVLDASGRPGTLEQFASALGFLEAYRDAGGGAALTGAEVAARAEQDQIAATAADAVAARIAQACGMFVNALNLEACLLGGGLTQACPSLPSRVARHLPRYAWPYLMRRVEVVAAETGTDAGLIGAACRAAEHRSD